MKKKKMKIKENKNKNKKREKSSEYTFYIMLYNNYINWLTLISFYFVDFNF